MVKNVALVLGGGGSAGHAWTIGVIAGLAEAGIDMTEAADLVIGTSSGATAAAQVRSGMPAAELLASVLSTPVQPVGQSRERPPSLPIAVFGQWGDWILQAGEAAACPVDYVAAPLLTSASALIGHARWAQATLEQDSKRLNRKGDSHERGIVIQDSGWGEGASIEWQDPIRRTCGIVWLVRWQAAAPVGRRRHCLG